MKIYSCFFLLLTACLFFCTDELIAQRFSFQPVAAPEGVRFGIVTGITQDKKTGYIWFTTQTGLYRYNGYSLKTYLNDPLKTNSVAADRLETIFADQDGKIWIGAFGKGLDEFDPASETFKHFTHLPADPNSLSNDTVISVLRDHTGLLWIGTHRGLNSYDSVTKKFTRYQYRADDPRSLSSNDVRCLYEDRQGTLWVGTGSPFFGDTETGGGEGGLNRFDPGTKTFKRYQHDTKDNHSLIDNRITALYEDSHGNFWVGTPGDGLHTMNRATGEFEQHTYDSTQPDRISRPPLKKLYGYADDHITFINEDQTGSLWIGTLAGGINRYDPKSKKISYYRTDTSGSRKGFKESGAWKMLSSSDGMIWISAWQESFYRVDPFQIQIPHESLPLTTATAFASVNPEVFLIGTSNGLIRKELLTGKSKLYVTDSASIASLDDSHIQTMTRERNGTVWIGTVKGLHRYDDQNQTFTRFPNEPGNKKSFPLGIVTSIYEDRQSALWIGSSAGLSKMAGRTNSFTNYIINPGDTNFIGTNLVSAIVETNRKELWIGTWAGGGVHIFEPATGNMKTYLKGISVSRLFEDRDSILWVCSEYGLYHYERNTDSFYQYTDKSLLKGVTGIGNIFEDQDKNLWVTVVNGILRINASRDETSLYGSKNDYAADFVNYFSGYKAPNSEFFIGANEGYYHFFPDQLTKTGIPPQINITGFRLADQLIAPSSKGPLFQELNQTKEIRLNYQQNVFSFDFEAIDYHDPEANRHVYMLENFDPSWRQGGTERKAFYFNVPPGEYIFKVKAANSAGIWQEKDIRLIITPPWWHTWWAYALYAMGFLTIAFGVNRYIRKRIIEKEQMKNREKELVQAKEIEKAYHELKVTQAQLIQSEKMASLGELTAGIAHEIQNPLNFVNNFSDINTELIEEATQEINKGNVEEVRVILNDIKDNEEKINHHGKRADAIVKGMLQHSRSSTGQKEPTDINALADEYLRLSYHGLRSKDKSFNAIMKTSFDEELGKINIIPQDIGRVLLNLYTNGFYATNEKKKMNPIGFEPTLSVTTRRIGEEVEIIVGDNGNGVPQSVIDKIFQPFFTTKPTGVGTGLGLSLSYDIIKAHGGLIRVETKEGEYTRFIIRLPDHRG